MSDANKRYQTAYSNKAFIWVQFEFEGLHEYPDAPDEVSFLRNSHRHIFKVRVDFQVYHSDREIEFIMFKRFLEYDIPMQHDLNHMSCEMLCDFFHEAICEKYNLLEPVDKLGIPSRKMIIEVSEDGENGAHKIYYPHSYDITDTGDIRKGKE